MTALTLAITSTFQTAEREEGGKRHSILWKHFLEVAHHFHFHPIGQDVVTWPHICKGGWVMLSWVQETHITRNRRLDKVRKGIGSTSTIYHRMINKDLYDCHFLSCLWCPINPLSIHTHSISAVLNCLHFWAHQTPHYVLFFLPSWASILFLSTSFLPNSISSPISPMGVPCSFPALLQAPKHPVLSLMWVSVQCVITSDLLTCPLLGCKCLRIEPGSYSLPRACSQPLPSTGWCSKLLNYQSSLHFPAPLSEATGAWTQLAVSDFLKIVGIKYLMTVASKLNKYTASHLHPLHFSTPQRNNFYQFLFPSNVSLWYASKYK